MSLPAKGLARERAVEVFSQLRVWDTEHNNGVLIYPLLADRSVEIAADRGIHAKVESRKWDAVRREMEAAFRTC
ncbi:TPM domain-containing protein [Cupriavidus basilensis]